MPEDFARQAKDMAREEVRRVIANAEQYRRLKEDDNYTNVQFDNYSGGVMAIHKGHAMHNGANEQRFFGGLTSGDLEMKCGEQLMRMGYSVVFVDESMTQLNENGLLQFLPSLDILLDGKPMDISSVTTDGKITSHLSYKNKQIGNVIRKTGVESDSLVLYYYNPDYYTEQKMLDGIRQYNYIMQMRTKRIYHVYVVLNGKNDVLQYDI